MKYFEHFERKNHIKYIFLFREKSIRKFTKTGIKPIYLFGYLTDDHQLFFDEFQMFDTFEFSRGTLRQFIRKTRLHYIDSKTEVCFFFGTNRNYQYKDIMFLLWSIYHRGYGFHFTKLIPGIIVNTLNRVYNLQMLGPTIPGDGHKMNNGTATTKMCDIFDMLAKNRICSWINDEFCQRIALLRPTRMKYYKLVSVALYYMLINNYRRYQEQYRAAMNARILQKKSPESEATMIPTSTILMDKDNEVHTWTNQFDENIDDIEDIDETEEQEEE